jgi:hypothetical protein
MMRTKKRINEIKETALENLKRADNSRDNLDKEVYWSLYRSDVRELLGVIEDYEETLQRKRTVSQLQAELAQLVKVGNDG